MSMLEDEILVPAPGTNMKEGLGHNLHLILSYLYNWRPTKRQEMAARELYLHDGLREP